MSCRVFRQNPLYFNVEFLVATLSLYSRFVCCFWRRQILHVCCIYIRVGGKKTEEIKHVSIKEDEVSHPGITCINLYANFPFPVVCGHQRLSSPYRSAVPFQSRWPKMESNSSLISILYRRLHAG